MLTRSHIAVAGHKKKRSTIQAEAGPAREYLVSPSVVDVLKLLETR